MIKRLVLLFALLTLLGQWSYTTAGSLCTHEPALVSAEAHWGHHFHAHADEDHGSSKPAKPAKLSDVDCGFCHAQFPSAVPLATEVPPSVGDDPLNPAVPVLRLGTPAAIPDRPDWSLSRSA